MSKTTINMGTVSPVLHAAYKAKCALHGRSMRGMILAFMRDAIRPSGEPHVVNFGKLSAKYPYKKLRRRTINERAAGADFISR